MQTAISQEGLNSGRDLDATAPVESARDGVIAEALTACLRSAFLSAAGRNLRARVNQLDEQCEFIRIAIG